MINENLLDGRMYADIVRSGAAKLGLNRTTVNDLNVFPVPDGDTGDNMYMTINAGSAAADTESIGYTAAAVSRGMLTGARGNSGVILSRIFAGIAKGLAGLETADVGDLSRAMQMGIDEAYAAVNRPVEGTILTVYKDAVKVASQALNESSSFETFFKDFVEETKCSLERTPELLAVLREAGVVDSGGAGLMYIAEGMLECVQGKAQSYLAPVVPYANKMPDISLFDENSVLDYGYCTEFLLRLQKSKLDLDTFDENELFDWLNANGDSVVAFRDGTIIKVHVHTHTPGEILNHCQKYGEFLTMKIENMTLEHNENRPTEDEKKQEPVLRKTVKKQFATVAVACGSGVREMFRSLGTDAVIDGGQSMNPSSGDFIAAFDKISADTIFVFPNNGNVILAANQAAELYETAEIRVIPTKTIGDGYAALSMFDTNGSADEIEENLKAAMEGVKTGMVCRACRDAEGCGVSVKNGDFIGFEDKNIYSDSPSRKEAALDLADKLKAGSCDVVILLKGAEADETEAAELADELQKKYPRTEFILTDGGQPVHDYILILE